MYVLFIAAYLIIVFLARQLTICYKNLIIEKNIIIKSI